MTDYQTALKDYLDDEGRLKNWPSARNRKGLQTTALDFLASKFEVGKDYTEKEVNELLNRFHTFGDPAMLRRELYQRGSLGREKDGSRYWRIVE